MSNNNIIDGSGLTSEVFSSAYDGTSISNAGAAGSTETVATWGDLIVMGLPGYAHSPDPNPNATQPSGSWGTAQPGAPITPGGNGKAFVYNKSTDTTVELVQPSADINHQQSFGYGVVINDSYIAVFAPQQTHYGYTPKIYLYDHAGVYQGVRIEGPQMNSSLGMHTRNPGIFITDSYIIAIASTYNNNSSRVYVYDLTGTELGYISSGGNNTIQGIGVIGNTVITGYRDSLRKYDITGINNGQVITSPTNSLTTPGGYQFGSIEVIDNDYFVVSYLNKHSTGHFEVRKMSDLTQVGSDFVGNTGATYYGNYLACNGSGLLAVGTFYLSEDVGGYVDVYSHNAGSLTLESTIVQSDAGTSKTTYSNYLDFAQNSLVIADRNAHLVYPFTVGSSVQPRAITVTGDVQQGSFSPYVAGGYSYEFDGNGDSLKITGVDTLGSGDFSVEFWMKSSTNNKNLINPATSTGAGTWGLYFDADELRWMDGYTATIAFGVDGSSVLDDVWHHIAVVRESGTFAVYFDGVAQTTASYGDFSDTTNYSVSDDLEIGNGYRGYYDGLLNDLRIVVGTAVYTDDFTPPTEPLTLTSETVLLTCNKPYISAVGNEYSPASVSTTEVFDDAESTTMISGYASSYPGLGSHRNLRISPNGEHTLVGAQNFRHSMYGNNVRGRVYLLSTDDLGNISHQIIDPPNYSQGGFSHGWTNAGAAVAVTDNHAAITAVRFSQGNPNHTKIDNAIANGTWPTSVASGWEWEPNVLVYALNDLSDYKFLATTGTVKHQVSMSGNYVAVADEGTGGGTYGSGIWVYDITDAAMTASAGTSFAPSGSGTYLDVANGDIVFPKYFIPRIGSASDYVSGYCTIHFSGDYIVRCAPNANNNGGRIEVYKFSDLKTIASGQTQVSPHATWNESTSGLKLGHWMRTDGTGIIASSGMSGTSNNIKVFDMDLNLLHTLNGSDYGSNAYFDDVSISTNYLMMGGRMFDGNTGGYLVLDRSDPSVVLKEGHGDSANDKMGHSVEISQDETFFAHVSQLSSENGELNLESMSVTPAGYSSVSHSTTLSGDVSTERSAPYVYVDYSAATHGGSAYFDGNGDELLIAASEDFNFGTGDFTIEMWVKTGSSSDATVWKNDSMRIQTFSNYIQVQESTNVELKYPLGYTFKDVWVHIALVREGGTFKLFANGSEITNTVTDPSWGNTSQNFDYSSTGQQVIGSNTGSNYMTGHISDVRVVKGTAVYTADFTVPSAPLTAVTGTTLLLPFDDATIIDKSGSAVISVQGDVAVSDVAPPYVDGKSLTFDGDGDYVEAQDADISLSGDFTIEAWVKVSSASGNQQIVAFPGTSNDVGLLTSGASFVFADGTTNLISGGTVVVDQWHHVAVSRSSETVTLFVDGASVGTSSGHTATVGTSGDVNVGSDTSNGNLLTGELADIRIRESAVYTDTFTPPTGSYWG